ncbi:MAG: YncE family protein [Phycisphaerae bacterium]|jgi:DNA-binding beta-propeller fold protein YncE
MSRLHLASPKVRSLRSTLPCALVACIAAVASGTHAAQPAAENTADKAAAPSTKQVTAVIYSTRGDEKIHVLNASDLSLLASIDTGAGLHELAVDSSGRFLVGSAYGGPSPGHLPADKRIIIIDLAKAAVHKVVTLEDVERPNDIAFIPGTTDAYITAEAPQHLIKLNAVTGAYEKFPLRRGAGHMLSLSGDAKTVYVSHVMPGNLSVFNTTTSTTDKLIKLPEGAEAIATSPDGSQVWVASHSESRISIVTTASNEVTQSLILPGIPFRMEFAPSGKSVAVACPAANAVAFIDTSTPSLIRFVDTNILEGQSIKQQQSPKAVAYSPDGNTVFAVCSGEVQSIVAIDTQTHRITNRVDTLGPIADALTTATIQWPAS